MRLAWGGRDSGAGSKGAIAPWELVAGGPQVSNIAGKMYYCIQLTDSDRLLFMVISLLLSRFPQTASLFASSVTGKLRIYT